MLSGGIEMKHWAKMGLMKCATIRMSQFTKINPLSANPTKWSDTLKQFEGLQLKDIEHAL